MPKLQTQDGLDIYRGGIENIWVKGAGILLYIANKNSFLCASASCYCRTAVIMSIINVNIILQQPE